MLLQQALFVTKSIPKDCVAGGNPCKIIKNIRDIDIF